MLEGFLSANCKSKLFLTGNIPPSLETRIKNSDMIICAGFVSRDRLVQLIQISDICLCPRNLMYKHTNTTFPSKIFKYMQFKKHIVCVNHPGIPRSLSSTFTILSDNNHKTWEAFFRNSDQLPTKKPYISYQNIKQLSVDSLIEFLD